MPDLKDALDKKYSTTCPHCQKGIQPTRSIGMLVFGITEGHGQCPYCKKMMRLDYDAKADTLTACSDNRTDAFNRVLEKRLTAMGLQEDKN